MGIETESSFLNCPPIAADGSTLCGAESDPAINRLFIIDSSKSPDATHAPGHSVDEDDDALRGLAPVCVV